MGISDQKPEKGLITRVNNQHTWGFKYKRPCFFVALLSFNGIGGNTVDRFAKG